jgi:hypothetical protein
MILIFYIANKKENPTETQIHVPIKQSIVKGHRIHVPIKQSIVKGQH